MNLKEMKLKLLALDPNDIVKADLDNFSPYAYVDYPQDMKEEMKQMSPEDQREFGSFEQDYLDALANESDDELKQQVERE